MAAGDLHPSLPVSEAFAERDTAFRGSGLMSFSREAANLRRLSVGVVAYTHFILPVFPGCHLNLPRLSWQETVFLRVFPRRQLHRTIIFSVIHTIVYVAYNNATIQSECFTHSYH